MNEQLELDSVDESLVRFRLSGQEESLLTHRGVVLTVIIDRRTWERMGRPVTLDASVVARGA